MTVTNQFQRTSMLSPKDFGLHLRSVRFKAGYKTIPGFDMDVLRSIERGDRYPTLEELYLIAEGTSIPLWGLLPPPDSNRRQCFSFAMRSISSFLYE